MARRDGIVWAGIRAMVAAGDDVMSPRLRTGPMKRKPDEWMEGCRAVEYHEAVVRAVLESAGVHLVELVLALKCGVADGEAEELVAQVLADDPSVDG